MKILCVIDSLGSGGAQRQLVGLAVGFKNKGYDVSFLTYHNINFFKETLLSNGISVNTIIEPNHLLRIYRLRKFMRSGDFKIVLSFLSGPCLISELASLPLKKWKLIVGERSANPNMVGSIKWAIYKWLHLLADYVVANSHVNITMVRQISPLISKDKCKVIYNMVDLQKWSPQVDYTPFKNGKVNIVIASSHRHLKNLKGLVEAVNRLSDYEKNKIDIKWYGDTLDSSFEECTKKIADYNLVSIFSFYPATPGISEIIAKSDYVALFSIYEGLPNAICEGMACGKPILASAISDVPRLVEENINGFLFDPHNTESILAAMRKVINSNVDDIVRMGKSSRDKAELLFEEEMILKSYINLF